MLAAIQGSHVNSVAQNDYARAQVILSVVRKLVEVCFNRPLRMRRV